MGIKKLCAGLAAAATLLGGLALGASAANAAAPTGTATITIRATDTGAIAGHTFKAVRVGTYGSFEPTTDGTKVKGVSVDTYAEDSAVKTAADTALTAVDPNWKNTAAGKIYADNPIGYVAAKSGYDANNNYNDSDENAVPQWSGNLRNFVDNLVDVQKLFNNPSPDNTYETKAAENGTSAVFENLPEGIYVVIDATAVEKGDEGETVYGNSIPMFVGTKIYGRDLEKQTLGEVKMKNEPLTVIKTPNSRPSGIGEEKTYTITAPIPNTTGHQNNKFSFEDVPGLGLTVDSTNWELTLTATKDGKNSKTLAKDTDYTVSMPKNEAGAEVASFRGDGSKDFTVDLSKWLAKDEHEAYIGGTFTMTYKATVNEEAPKTGIIDNKVTVDRNGTTTFDQTKVFTGKFELTKDDKDGNGLAGAEFKLYKGHDAVDTAAAIKFVKSNVEGKTVYTVADDQSATLSDTIVDTIVTEKTDNNKVKPVQIFGLNGNYTLVETKAPTEFSQSFLPKVNVTVAIMSEAPYETFTQKVTFDAKEWGELVNAENDKLTVKVTNIRNITELPLTGAAGTALFSVVALLIAGAAATLAVKARNTKRMLNA